MDNIYGYFQKKALQKQVPYQVEIDLTNKCNCNCIFCFEGNDHKNLEKELTFDQIKNLLNELRNLGTYSIGYSGGEPFCRKDTIEILEYTRSLGFCTTIVTNGQLLSREQLIRLNSLNLKRITFSFHSNNNENYKYHFGNLNSSPKEILKKVLFLKELGANVGIAVTVTKYNIDELKDIYHFFIEKGIDNINFNMLTPGQKEIEKLIPSSAKIKNMISEFPEFCEIYKQKREGKSLLCNAARISATIKYNGDVYCCPFSNKCVGNITQDGFGDIWENSSYFKLIRKSQEKSFYKCNQCNNKELCNMCFVANEYYSGNMFEPNIKTCELCDIIKNVNYSCLDKSI